MIDQYWYWPVAFQAYAAVTHSFFAGAQNVALLKGVWVTPMSAIGTKRTWAGAMQMSAIGGKADLPIALQNVR